MLRSSGESLKAQARIIGCILKSHYTVLIAKIFDGEDRRSFEFNNEWHVPHRLQSPMPTAAVPPFVLTPVAVAVTSWWANNLSAASTRSSSMRYYFVSDGVQ